MTTQKAKQIPIQNILAKLNYFPNKTAKHELWYLSPLRKENTPSFKVDINQNLWYDHGAKVGGTTIDLIMNLYNFTIKEALQELSYLTGNSTHKTTQTTFKAQNNRHRDGVKTKSFNSSHPVDIKNDIRIAQIIKSIEPLYNEALLEYLTSRRINLNIARHYLQEIYYQVDSKNYFALGFKNDSGGYELRSKYYKGSLKGSPKDITTLINQNEENEILLIFEGFIDFLSFFTVKSYQQLQDLKEDVIVLNSLAMLEKTIEYINNNKECYSTIQLYLDNDDAGKQAVNKLMFYVDGVKVEDMSFMYREKKDLNEMIV